MFSWIIRKRELRRKGLLKPIGITICQYGGVAQLGEHLPCKQGVKSSNLSISIHWRIQCKSWDIFFESANWRRSFEETSNGSAKQRLLVPWKLHTEIDKRFFIKTSEKINHNKTVKKFTRRVFETQDPVFQRYEIQLIRGQARKSAGWMPWH